jgi:hypothetical protein
MDEAASHPLDWFLNAGASALSAKWVALQAIRPNGGVNEISASSLISLV